MGVSDSLLDLLPKRTNTDGGGEGDQATALAEALSQVNSAHKSFKSQPNRASKLYFTAAKSASLVRQFVTFFLIAPLSACADRARS